MTCDVTICIPTYNGDEFLQDLFDAVHRQETKYSYEILVIDSGSRDQTLDICKKNGDVRLVEIPNSEFGHGRTRNRAVELSDSPFVAFLTQDAVPAHEYWLDSLIEPFELFPEVSCVVGKQIPRKDCVVTVKREVITVFKAFGDDAVLSISRVSDFTRHLGIMNTFFSDVNSAVRKECILEVPFRDVEYAEDQALAVDHMQHGWMKAYTPLGSVTHSHDYPPKKFFKRKIDEHTGLYGSLQWYSTLTFPRFLYLSMTGTVRDWMFLIRDKEYSFGQKFINFFKAPLYNFLGRLADWMTSSPKKIQKNKKHSLEAVARKS